MTEETIREIALHRLSREPLGLTLELAEGLRSIMLEPSTPLLALTTKLVTPQDPWATGALQFRVTVGEFTKSNRTLSWVERAILEVGNNLVQHYKSRNPAPVEAHEEDNEPITSWRDLGFTRPTREHKQATVGDLITALNELVDENCLRRDRRIQLTFLIAVFL